MKTTTAWLAAMCVMVPRGELLAQTGRGVGMACETRTPATSPGGVYVGTWRGNVLRPQSDSVMVTFTWVQRADNAGAFTFARETTSSPTRTVTVSSDSIVFDLLRPINAPNAGVDSGFARVVLSACADSVDGFIFLRSGGAGQRARITGKRGAP